MGIGFITWDLARSPERLAVALARRPAAVMLSFGDAAPFLDRIRASGARVLLQVQTLAGAGAAAALEPDAIVAQGTEAGGHGGGRSQPAESATAAGSWRPGRSALQVC